MIYLFHHHQKRRHITGQQTWAGQVSAGGVLRDGRARWGEGGHQHSQHPTQQRHRGQTARIAGILSGYLCALVKFEGVIFTSSGCYNWMS